MPGCVDVDMTLTLIGCTEDMIKDRVAHFQKDIESLWDAVEKDGVTDKIKEDMKWAYYSYWIYTMSEDQRKNQPDKVQEV